jgi:hypothetical protein
MRVKRRRQRREDGDGGAENDPQDVAGAREALAVAVEAVARAADGPGTDVVAEYAEQRWRMPLERAMAAADIYSLSRAKIPSADTCETQGPTSAAEIAELARLAASVSPGVQDSVRERLEAQKARMNTVREGVRPVECPAHMSVDPTTAEDPLEARRDSRGGAVPLGTSHQLIKRRATRSHLESVSCWTTQDGTRSGSTMHPTAHR